MQDKSCPTGWLSGGRSVDRPDGCGSSRDQLDLRVRQPLDGLVWFDRVKCASFDVWSCSGFDGAVRFFQKRLSWSPMDRKNISGCLTNASFGCLRQARAKWDLEIRSWWRWGPWGNVLRVCPFICALFPFEVVEVSWVESERLPKIFEKKRHCDESVRWSSSMVCFWLVTVTAFFGCTSTYVLQVFNSASPIDMILEPRNGLARSGRRTRKVWCKCATSCWNSWQGKAMTVNIGLSWKKMRREQPLGAKVQLIVIRLLWVKRCASKQELQTTWGLFATFVWPISKQLVFRNG